MDPPPVIEVFEYKHMLASGFSNLALLILREQSAPTDSDCLHTRRAIHWALRLVREEGLNHRNACWRLYCEHQVFVPAATLKNWIKAASKIKP